MNRRKAKKLIRKLPFEQNGDRLLGFSNYGNKNVIAAKVYVGQKEDSDVVIKLYEMINGKPIYLHWLYGKDTDKYTAEYYLDKYKYQKEHKLYIASEKVRKTLEREDKIELPKIIQNEYGDRFYDFPKDEDGEYIYNT